MADVIEKEEKQYSKIAEILRDFLKVIKVVTLYPENNPLPASLKRSFSDSLEWFVEEQGELNFHVKKDQILINNEVVYENKSKEESLAAIFFDAGVTQLVLKVGLNLNDIYSFLDIIKTYLNSPAKTVDLVSLFWEEGIANIALITLEDTYLSEYNDEFDYKNYLMNKDSDELIIETNLDDLKEYSDIFNDDDSRQRVNVVDLDNDSLDIKTDTADFFEIAPRQDKNLFDSLDVNSEQFQTRAAASAMGFDDLPSEQAQVNNLLFTKDFKNSEEEQVKIAEFLKLDAEFDPYESTTELVKEILLQELDLQSFTESVTICSKIVHEFIHKSKIAEAGQILKYLGDCKKKWNKEKPLWVEKIKDAFVTAGSRDRLTQLAEVLNNNIEISVAELKGYLDNFGWEALNGIADLLSQVENEHHRQCIADYIIKNGSQNVDLISRGMFDKRIEVVLQTIYIMGKIGNPRALGFLAKACDHEEKVVRIQLLNAIKDNPDENAIKILKICATDNDNEIRNLAIEYLASLGGKQAFETIEEIITSDLFDKFEDRDKKALLHSYSTAGKDRAVAYLTQIASKYYFFNGRVNGYLRRIAFESLCINRSEKALHALVRLSKSFFPEIREMAKSSLIWRRENMQEGSHDN